MPSARPSLLGRWPPCWPCPSTPGELSELGRSLGSEGITVTTIGLGLEYNEDLMTQLAMASDGNHMFAENAYDVAQAFAQELDDVLSVVAQRQVVVLFARAARSEQIAGDIRPVVGRVVVEVRSDADRRAGQVA